MGGVSAILLARLRDGLVLAAAGGKVRCLVQGQTACGRGLCASRPASLCFLASFHAARHVPQLRAADAPIRAPRVSSRGLQADDTVTRVLQSGQIKPDTQLTVALGGSKGHLHLSASAATVFLVLAPDQYPRRHALRLLGELSAWAGGKISDESVAGAQGEGALNAETKFFFKSCLQRYKGEGAPSSSGGASGSGGDGDGDTRVDEVKLQIEEVKATMHQNIEKVMDNAESLSRVEEKGDILLDSANEYRNKAVTVRRTLWLRMWKMRIIVMLVVGAILGYILVPLFT